jgi:hypothetical protein
MVKSNGNMVLPCISTAPAAMSSASIRPDFIRGAATTPQSVKTRHACRVSSSGSPGPTLTA